jgi:SAM-dependent methyltransferase
MTESQTSTPGGTTYTFGDAEAASLRLRLLSEVFAPSTAAFLREAVPERPDLVVDLGCGPGHTTVLLASVLGAARTVGLDSSVQFLDEAAASAPAGVTYARHDVTAVPFPTDGAADVLYARFLLMHLPQPAGVLERWASAVVPGGRVVAQESEAIATDEPALQTYLDIVAGMLADNGNEIYLGPHLAAVDRVGPLGQVMTRVWRISIPADVTARLYRLNVQSWRDRDHIRRTVSEADLRRLEDELVALSATTDRPGIEWDVRGVVFARDA